MVYNFRDFIYFINFINQIKKLLQSQTLVFYETILKE